MCMRRRLLVTVAALVCSAGGARAQEVRREFAELHMGVAVRIELYAPADAAARVAARAAYTRIAELEDVMSDYRPQSEVRRLAEQPGIAVPVSEPLFAVLTRALALARQSDGAFDITVGPFVALWRSARRTGRLPNRAQLDSAARRVGWHKVHAGSAPRSIRLDTAGSSERPNRHGLCATPRAGRQSRAARGWGGGRCDGRCATARRTVRP